jgi:hypothetical protein
MRNTIAWYQKKKWDAWVLFSPYTADYFPIALHTASSYNDVAKKAYHEIKSEYPKLVQQARKKAPEEGSVSSSSRVGDNEDFVSGGIQIAKRDILKHTGGYK